MQKQKFISEMGLMTDLGLTLQFNNFVSKAYLKAKKCKKIATNCKFLQYFLVIRIFFTTFVADIVRAYGLARE